MRHTRAVHAPLPRNQSVMRVTMHMHVPNAGVHSNQTCDSQCQQVTKVYGGRNVMRCMGGEGDQIRSEGRYAQVHAHADAHAGEVRVT